eukprot:353810-Chlamydomonas_euryale.AAC.1
MSSEIHAGALRRRQSNLARMVQSNTQGRKPRTIPSRPPLLLIEVILNTTVNEADHCEYMMLLQAYTRAVIVELLSHCRRNLVLQPQS